MILIKNHKELAKKYFFPFLFALATFIMAVVATEMDKHKDLVEFWRVLGVIALGISIGFGIEFWQIQDQKKRTAARLTGVAFILLQVFVSIWIVDTRKFSYLYANLFLLSHLFVALSFWFNSKNRHLPDNERNRYFWNQNWRLFIGFQSSALVNGILYLGLVLALYSLDLLFGFKVPDRTFLYLFYFLATVGGSVYLASFLEGKFKEENESKILSSLVRYIFPFLQILYFTILYLYLIKIVASWSLPRGYVAWLVSGLSILICLSHLIIKPVQEKFSHEKIMQAVWRSSFILMIPLLGLMLVSLNRRIGEYGLTENRYVLLMLTFWMIFISLTHLKPQKAKLQWIPLSLFILALVTTTGPLNSYVISYWSQRHRLQSQLQELHGQLVNNELVFPEKVASADQVRFVRTMRSICTTYGVSHLFEFLGSKDLPVILSSDEYNCVYQSGNNDSSHRPFGALVNSTKFEVLVNDSFLYSSQNEVLVTSGSTQQFSFGLSETHSAYAEAFGFSMAQLTIANYSPFSVGAKQLHFQKSDKNKINWVPEKGLPQMIDLQPIMEKLAKKEKTYLFKDHPEDQTLKIENEFTQVEIRILRLQFSKSDSDFALGTFEIMAVGKDKDSK